MGQNNLVEHNKLLEALTYDAETGNFTWRKDRPLSHVKNMHAYNTYQSRFAGKVAGYSSAYGDKLLYVQVRLFGKLYLAHRLAWFYMTGKWPENRIDHRDGNGENNRFSNLREVDSPTNGKNCVLSKNNTSGVNGVYWNKANSKWVAEGHYTEDGIHKKKNLGSYIHLEDAKLARLKWQEEQGGFTDRHGK